MIDQRRMTPSERERDLRRRNINPHAPCVIADTGTPASVWVPVSMWMWVPRGCGRCYGGAIGQHMPYCDTGEEMSFREWLSRRHRHYLEQASGALSFLEVVS